MVWKAVIANTEKAHEDGARSRTHPSQISAATEVTFAENIATVITSIIASSRVLAVPLIYPTTNFTASKRFLKYSPGPPR